MIEFVYSVDTLIVQKMVNLPSSDLKYNYILQNSEAWLMVTKDFQISYL